MQRFERASSPAAQFNAYAVISIAAGVPAVTLAFLPWILMVLNPEAVIIGTLGSAVGLPASLMGIVTGIIAMRSYGAAASRSMPMARGGFALSLVAALAIVAWLVIFFSSAPGTMLPRPPQSDEGEDPQRHAAVLDLSGISTRL